jgi:Skp family chaperone for outer membrane proteins|uniref:OmpH family outer membrane protein n=1 Tax=Altererythrobacter segetis TaxID=1104773 RepID=UPI00140A1812|nr:OmpH family outer membrane protein [Altererythrobacter segetis]
MKRLLSTAAALALATTLATPASAQVSGIGVAEPAVIVAGSQALSGAYTQISTMYAAQRTQLNQLDQQRVALIKKFDTNNDGQLDQAEQKAAQVETNPTRKQLETLDQQISTVQQPINLAAAYAVSQIAQQLGAAVQQVVSAGGVQLILPSNDVLYAADAANLNQKIVTALNTRLPQVSITPPAGWQPDQSTIQLFQDVQQVRLAAAQQMAAQQQQAGAAKPAAQAPATTAPVKGR